MKLQILGRLVLPAILPLLLGQDQPGPATSDPRPIHFFVRSGQSLSRGAVGWCGRGQPTPCSTGTGDNVMLGATYPPGGEFRPLAEFYFTGLGPPAVETSATAMCNQFSAVAGFRCGTANYGWPGASFGALAKGGTGCKAPCPYDNSIGQLGESTTGTGVVQALANAAAEGTTLLVPGVYFNQGESEMGGSVDAVAYQGYMARLQSDYQTDINHVTGQTGLVPLFIVQKSSWASWRGGTQRTTPVNHRGADGVPTGQLQAALDHYSDGKIFIIGPDYATPYAADGVHKPAAAYRTQGGIEGKVMYQVTVERKPWRPFYPRSIQLSENVLRVRFWVPYAPLVFEETQVSPLPDGYKGFELTDTGGSGVTITNVALTEGQDDSVDITLSGIPASTVELRYAWTAAGTGASYAGPTNGPRGNVADSDTRTSVQGDPLRDYALTFRIGGISAEAPHIWEPPDPDNLGSIAASPAPIPVKPVVPPCENCVADGSRARNQSKFPGKAAPKAPATKRW